MIQLDLEQRQSSRFSRPFCVTDHEDTEFALAFDGFDVNLTGLSFWVDEPDMFLPSQLLSIRTRNEQTDEVYCLEGVEVIHLREVSGRYLCGCHISQVTSGQLLAHHRLVMTDEQSALVSMQDSELSEFNFVEEGSKLSTDEADFQEASMALNLAVAQSEANLREVESFFDRTAKILTLPLPAAAKLIDLKEEFEYFKSHVKTMNETTLAFATLAKLLAHTPEGARDRQAWKTLISDFENRFLSEKQQIAYDFMHQGMSAGEAIRLAEEYLSNQSH
ncbi:PilZ domain-containing protein [Thiosulfativibrio zosterae]|uniref:Uncharacterized protein n=1 Tax=Thiosulfativibrio zosterae TaxID=2675053 RepID=A0A6F8PMR8_9GAMM|nr:PilZ domain-containing protein [Thiosulfativibrio zosterae]BBP43399.1 hypothetical protein THMIRHAT_11450 [Thiosulfativibrio zosterae]